MHYKVVWGIIVVAIIGIFYFKNKDKENKDTNVNLGCNEDSKETTNIISHTKAPESDDTLEFNDVKANVAKKMGKQHEEAEKIIKESVENVFGDVEVGEIKNETTKKKMFGDLNNI